VKHYALVLENQITIFLLLMRFLTDLNAAWAHAIIVSSSPAAGATVASDAVSIRLRFNSRIDHARSRLTLFAPDGAPQALTPASDSPLTSSMPLRSSFRRVRGACAGRC